MSGEYEPTEQEVDARADVLLAGRSLSALFLDASRGVDTARFYRARAREQLIREHGATPAGGPPRMGALSVDEVSAMVDALWPAEGDPPTLEVTAGKLGKSERWVSHTVGGWQKYIERRRADRNNRK